MFIERWLGRSKPERHAWTAPMLVPLSGERHHLVPEARLTTGSFTQGGPDSAYNGDAIAVVRPHDEAHLATQGILAVVCDAMDATEHAERASVLARDTVVRAARDVTRDPHVGLARALASAHAALVSAGSVKGVACTALLVHRGMACCAHVGNTRCYLARSGELYVMTEDHSHAITLVRQGILTFDEARTHPGRLQLTRALGHTDGIEVATWPAPLEVLPGDRFLVCSDGVSDALSHAEIRDIVCSTGAQRACEVLVERARRAGCADNLSAAMISMHAGPTRPPAIDTPLA
ncbi:MAG: serine/threonine-protein phosphatase [Gemmatimonadetes bacterium]|nr:serine/threonine-protein phosphatase [Gemmatimonadota bacterium]